MFTVRHNIDAVQAELKKFKSQVPLVAFKSLDPEEWLPMLKQVAEDTLGTLAKGEAQEKLVPLFVATISGRRFPGGSRRFVRFTMSEPGQYRGTIIALTVQAPRGRNEARTREAMEKNEFAQAAKAELEDAIRDWVDKEKRKERQPGGRDAGKSNEEISMRMFSLVGTRGPMFKDQARRNPAMETAARGLMKHIGPFMAKREQGQQELATGQKWLVAVGRAWFEKLEAEIPAAMLNALLKQWETGKA